MSKVLVLLGISAVKKIFYLCEKNGFFRPHPSRDTLHRLTT